MNPRKANQLIVASLAVTGAMAAGSALVERDLPGVGLVIGLTVTGIGLAFLAMLAPQLAASFALLILVAGAINYGGPLFRALARILK